MYKLNKLVSGALLLALAGCSKSAHYQMNKSNAIAEEAKSNEGSTAWATDTKATQRGNKDKVYHIGKPKCNLFVHDMLYDAGITPPTQGGWALQAKNWASSTYSIPNWEHKGTGVPWEPGDVIAEKRDYIDATGHCGIVLLAVRK
ncbi:MAG TPA: hypothetical protein VK133_04310 [Amoebophilaceae bacterium]|nr:hypothetical protein [Amoebophilaceae bacterium]